MSKKQLYWSCLLIELKRQWADNSQFRDIQSSKHLLAIDVVPVIEQLSVIQANIVVYSVSISTILWK